MTEGNRCADELWPHCKRVRVSPVTPVILKEETNENRPKRYKKRLVQLRNI